MVAAAGPALQLLLPTSVQVQLTALAENSPAEWARLNQPHDEAPSRRASRRGQHDCRPRAASRGSAFHHAKQSDHAKLSQKTPDYFFGAPNVAKDLHDLTQVSLRKSISRYA